MNKINWKEVCKFLSGVFFVFACASLYFAYYKIYIPIMGWTMPHEFIWIHAFLHFVFFILIFYFGFVRKKFI
jgi:hypothetical protein